jgi:hypothetical protein
MTMHDLPDTLFRSKDARNPQSNRGELFRSANLGLQLLYLHQVCKVRSYEVTGITIEQFADGKIVEDWTNFDALGMMQQLGLIPEPGQAGS